MKKHLLIFTILCCYFSSVSIFGKLINANYSNYTNLVKNLQAGDTLYLEAGGYANNLVLNSLNGTKENPIVIIGESSSTIFFGQECCNTISITKSSFIVIKSLRLNGLHNNIDAIKAEGTAGNWSHDIVIENIEILNYDNSQQNVGISTKCPSWNWIIRKNKISSCGTGMYLGNSPGDKPFVNGIIENNLITGCIGYNIEIKHQLNGTRELMKETSIDAKTIIRHNVFSKDEKSSSGENARPNLLVGGFPSSGWGSQDYYEIYGNFFYNNPVEALFQATGNVMLYNNIFVNHFDPKDIRAVYITPQNGINPQDIKIFHNTIWAANSSGGLRIYDPNKSFKQYCFANAVFSENAISNFKDTMANISDTYSNAENYFISAKKDIKMLDLYPLLNKLNINTSQVILFDSIANKLSDWDLDFNSEKSDWAFAGAYSKCCANFAWKLKLENKPSLNGTSSVLIDYLNEVNDKYVVNLSENGSFLKFNQMLESNAIVEIYDIRGILIQKTTISNPTDQIELQNLQTGIYFLKIQDTQNTSNIKFMID